MSTNQKYLNKKPVLNMTSWMKNQIPNIYSFVSADVGAIQDELVERLQSVCETASLLYNRMMNNIEYGREIERHRRKKSKGRRRNYRIKKRIDKRNH